MGSSRTIRTHLQLHGTLQLLPTLCQTQFLGQGSATRAWDVPAPALLSRAGEAGKCLLCMNLLLLPPCSVLSAGSKDRQGPGGLGRQRSCRKGLREMTRAGQDVPLRKAACEEDKGRKRTKISNVPTSLEQVTGVTTFQPSPWRWWGAGAPQALPLLLPISLCHTELPTHAWALGALPSQGGSKAHPGLCVLPTAAVHEVRAGIWALGAADAVCHGCGSSAPLEPGTEAPGHRESPRRRKAAGHCPGKACSIFRTLHVGIMNVLSLGIRAGSGDGCGKGEHS